MKAGLIPRFSCPIRFNFCQSPNTVSLRSRRSVLPSTRAVPLNLADVLSELLPSIKRFQGKTVVVKYGGAAIKSPQLRNFVVQDLVLLSYVGLKIVLVYDAGSEIKLWMRSMGEDHKYSDAIMEAAEMMLLGEVNRLGTLITLAGVTSLAICARNFLTSHAAPSAAALGYFGELSSVNPDILQHILSKSNLIPLIAPVATDHTGQTYHIHAETAAAEIAAAIRAEKLILLTDAAGILEDNNDPNSLIKEIDVSGITKMIEEGKLTGGIKTTVERCLKSLKQGERTISIVDGRRPHSLSLAMLTSEVVGTIIRN